MHGRGKGLTGEGEEREGGPRASALGREAWLRLGGHSPNWFHEDQDLRLLLVPRWGLSSVAIGRRGVRDRQGVRPALPLPGEKHL